MIITDMQIESLSLLCKEKQGHAVVVHHANRHKFKGLKRLGFVVEFDNHGVRRYMATEHGRQWLNTYCQK